MSEREDISRVGLRMHGPVHRAMKSVAVKSGHRIIDVYEAACLEFLEKRGVKVGA
jgi:hypothetical protein